MPGPRIIIEGRRHLVRQLADKLIRPEDGLRPWRKVAATLFPFDYAVEQFAPLQVDNGRPRRVLIQLEDYCEACQFTNCPGRGQADHARACADLEVSRLRRQVEAEAHPVHFTYHPPAYGEEDLDYLTRA